MKGFRGLPYLNIGSGKGITIKKLAESNIDILVNTSFNISKDPMVFDLFDVYTNMRRMNIEYIIMNEGIFKAKEI